MTIEEYEDLKQYVGSKNTLVDDLLQKGYEKGYEKGKEHGKTSTVYNFLHSIQIGDIYDILLDTTKAKLGVQEGSQKIVEYLQKIGKEL